MKVPVNGASGFFGKAVVIELVQRGHSIIAVGRSPENIEKKKNAIPVQADAFNQS